MRSAVTTSAKVIAIRVALTTCDAVVFTSTRACVPLTSKLVQLPAFTTRDAGAAGLHAVFSAANVLRAAKASGASNEAK